MASAAWCGALRGFLFEYDTPRIVLIKSRKVGLVNRAVQLAILAYVIGWVFVWEKGYQETDSVVSSVTTKVKGITVTNTSELGLRVWDVADYVIPPQGENTLFIMTNLIITLNQTQGYCPELPDKTTVCNSSKDCTAGYIGTHSNGVQTGKCRKYSTSVKTCEIYAWCPVENDTRLPKPAFLKDAENFTILVKNNIWYPKFNFTRRNILPSISTTYLKTCIYDPKTDPFCPIFRVHRIVEAAGQNFQEMAVEGGVMGVQINWNCDLDKSASYCVPKYTFRRLDNKDSDHTVSPGYNFSSKSHGTTLMYVSYVDDPHIILVDKQLSTSLQNIKGEIVQLPRDNGAFTDTIKLTAQCSNRVPVIAKAHEMQPLKSEGRTSPSHDRPSWCCCGKCHQTQSFREQLCCRRKEGSCITTSALFDQLVLSRSALEFILLYKEPLLDLNTETLNNQLRHCAYRQYIHWRFGSAEVESSALIPSCCRWKIRETYPSEDGKYTGLERKN